MSARMIRAGRLALGVLAAAMLSLASWQSARITYADWLERKATVAALRKAATIAPEDAHIHATLARLLREDEPSAAELEYREAIRLNPWDARSRVEAALLAERRGAYSAAEKQLLDAASIDTRFFPRWSLANFYLRRGDESSYWKWTRSAVQMSSASSLPSVFQLSAHVAKPGQDLTALLGVENASDLESYLRFAIASGRAHELETVARKLKAKSASAAIPVACDALIQIGRASEAVSVCPFFEEFRSSDWRASGVDGVAASIAGSPPVLRVQLSGTQLEQCELMWRYLPISGPGEIIISVDVHTENLPSESGVRWQLYDPVTGASVGNQQSWLAGNEWRTVEAAISVKKPGRGLRLALAYSRAPGTVRTTGVIALRHFRISGGRE